MLRITLLVTCKYSGIPQFQGLQDLHFCQAAPLYLLQKEPSSVSQVIMSLDVPTNIR